MGLIGGMSWHSTMTYYRIINEMVAADRGGHTSAPIALQSLDFAEVRECQVRGEWDRAGGILAEAGRRCVAGGASAVAICTNLMHKVAPHVEAAIHVPLVHIADAVAEDARTHGWGTVGVLGTRWVMEETFYADRLARHDVRAVAPAEADRELVDTVIFDELTRGIVTAPSRAAYVEVIDRLAAQGAEAVVLACTEIGLLVSPEDSPLPVIDSAQAHARMLGRVVLGELAPAR